RTDGTGSALVSGRGNYRSYGSYWSYGLFRSRHGLSPAVHAFVQDALQLVGVMRVGLFVVGFAAVAFVALFDAAADAVAADAVLHVFQRVRAGGRGHQVQRRGRSLIAVAGSAFRERGTAFGHDRRGDVLRFVHVQIAMAFQLRVEAGQIVPAP